MLFIKYVNGEGSQEHFLKKGEKVETKIKVGKHNLEIREATFPS